MKLFEVGKEYKVNGPGSIRIVKRSAHYVTFEGEFSGRKQTVQFGDSGFFGLGESLLIKGDVPGHKYWIFAAHEI